MTDANVTADGVVKVVEYGFPGPPGAKGDDGDQGIPGSSSNLFGTVLPDPAVFADGATFALVAGSVTTLYERQSGAWVQVGEPKGSVALEAAARAAADALLIPLTQRAAANGVATLDSGGKIPSSQIPAIALSTFLGAVASDAAMQALTGQVGDWTVRTDYEPDRAYMLVGADPTVLGNWQRMTFGDVISVEGLTGAVTLPHDPAAGTAGLRTLGTGATQAAAGNDSRLSDTRTPTDGSVTLAKLAFDVATQVELDAEAATRAAADLTRAPALTRTVVKSANYTAAANELVPVDTTAGAVTITLPNAPATSTRVAVKLILQGGTNAVTVGCAGADAFNRAGGATSLTLSLLAQAVLLDYDLSTHIWTILADDLPLADLDARFAPITGSTAYVSGVSLPAANGTDDTTALQAVLTANPSKRIAGTSGQSYTISAPLVLTSGQTLDMTGCTVTLKAGSNCSMVTNAAVTAVTRVTDAAMTASSAVMTSASAATAWIGKAVTVQGAGVGGAALTTTVSSVVVGVSATLAVAASTSVTARYAAVGPRDSNIAVIGGTWNRQNNGATGPSWTSNSLRFRNIDGITVRDISFSSTAGKYAVNYGDATRFEARRVTFTSTFSDGVHVNGPASHGSIRDIIGVSMGDDLVSLTANDFTTFDTMADCFGDITDVVVENAHLQGATVASCALKIIAGVNCTVRNITGRDLTCADDANTVHIGDDTQDAATIGGTYREIFIDGARSYANAGTDSVVVFLNSADMDRITLRNLTPETTFSRCGVEVSSRVTAGGRIVVEDSRWEGGLSFNGFVAVEGFIAHLTLNNIYAKPATGSCLVRLADGLSPDTVVTRLVINNCHLEPTAGNTTGTVRASTATSGITVLEINNLTTVNVSYPLGLLATVSSVVANNVHSTNMTGWVRAQGTTAQIKVTGQNLDGTTDAITVDAGSIVKSQAFGLRCDVSMLTHVAGAMAYNTNTSLAIGRGPVVSDGSGWARSPAAASAIEDTALLLDTGQEALDRRIMSTSSIAVATGELYLMYFKARKSETITKIRSIVRGTAASGGTVNRLGLFTVAADGTLTLVAATTHSGTLWNATFTKTDQALSASYAVVKGSYYAIALIFVGTTGPTVYGCATIGGASEEAQSPRITGKLTGQADLPAIAGTIASGSVGATSNGIYLAVIP